MVGHEEGVEPAALERLGEALEMREIEIGVRKGAGIAPGAGVDAGRPHERAEMQLAALGHEFSIGYVHRLRSARGQRSDFREPTLMPEPRGYRYISLSTFSNHLALIVQAKGGPDIRAPRSPWNGTGAPSSGTRAFGSEEGSASSLLHAAVIARARGVSLGDG